MKRIIIISLLTSVSLLTTSHAAATDDAFLCRAHTGAGSTRYPAPSTLEQLDSFLRRNCDTDFPEIGFSAFCRPFMPGFSTLKRLDQIRAQTAAIETLGQMVALGYYAFTQEIERLKVKIPHFAARAASRPEAMAHYKRFNHPHFLKFQDMITHLLELTQTKTGELGKDAKTALIQSHGSSDALKIAWLRDNTGIVPVPFQGNLKRIIYSSSTPYGDWGDDLQRSLVFIDGKLIEAPGIHIHTKDDGTTFKFVRENGLRDRFITSPITMRSNAGHPIISTLLKPDAFRDGPEPSTRSVFLTLPANPIEENEFKAAFLEELMEDATREDSPFAGAFISGYLKTLEYVEPKAETPLDAALADTAGTIESPEIRLNKHIDSLYEEQILAEQAEISRRVAEDSIEDRIRAPKKKSKSPITTTVASSEPVTEVSPEEKEALRREILSTLKERGRIKWRTLARALIAALKSAYADKTIMINVTEKGSHFMLHLKGETSSDGATIIRPHGKADRTLSAGEARGLADNLIDLTFKLMARQ